MPNTKNKKKVDSTYQKQIEQVQIDSEEYTDEEMLPVYKEQKKQLTALEVAIGGMFVKYAIDGLLKMTAQEKNNVGIEKTLKDMGKELGQSEIDKMSSILTNAYKDSYYKQAFIQDSGLKVDLKFDILKKEFIDSAVNTKFKGELFDERIWKNKAQLIDKLNASFTDAMQGKTTIDKIARDVKETFNVTAYQSQRLVRTENARIQAQATDEIARNTGVKKQMYNATLDVKTNPVDASFDGRVFDVDDSSKPELPLHPNCRCNYVNIIDGWTPTVRKDNETKEIIDYVKYDQWKTDRNIED